MEQQLGVVAVAQLPQADDDGGQAEDDVEEADDYENGVDQHGGLPPLPSLSEGSVGVPGQARGRVDDHRDGGQQGGEAGHQEEDHVRPGGSSPDRVSSQHARYDHHDPAGYPGRLPGQAGILNDGGGGETHQDAAADDLQGGQSRRQLEGEERS